MQSVNIAAFDEAAVSHEPYDFLLGSNVIKPEMIGDLRNSFPQITKPGYLTVDDVALHGPFKNFIEELEGPEVTEALSKRFGIDLHPYPRLTTIMKQSQPKYGAIHTDGPSKVMTMLVYMNDDWAVGDGGRLRVLHSADAFEPFAAEVPPTMGTVFAFLRADNSWHGHRPFVGERRVVQIAWLKSKEDLERKTKRNKLSQVLKGVFGR